MPKESGRIRHKLGIGVCQYPEGVCLDQSPIVIYLRFLDYKTSLRL